MTIITFTFLALCLSDLVGVACECVGVVSCNCVIIDGGKVIDCSSQRLTSVPSFADSADVFRLLNLANNSITDVAKEAFNGLYVEAIDLTGNRIKTIANEAFFGVENSLTRLLIGLDSTAVFPFLSFRGLARLESLSVVGFGGTALPDDCLRHVAQLKEFSATDGALTSLTSNQVKNSRNVRILNLNDNALTAIPKEALANSLTGVRSLSLANNKLAGIADGDLVGSIEDLDLSRNPLSNNISPNSFASLDTHLKYLNLKSCSLTDSVFAAISKLKALLVLQMQSNAITTIPAQSFLNAKSLQSLNLADNKLKRLSKESFDGLFNFLTSLKLEGNVDLSLTASNVFSSFESLKELNTDGARDLRLNSDWLLRCRNTLETLSLARTGVGPSVFPLVRTLTALKSLALESAAILEIPDFAFVSNSRLRSIDLSSNSITSVGQSSFYGLANSLVQLNLKANQLSSLDECVFHRFKNINYVMLDLTNNPLKCDCGLWWLHDAVKASPQFSSLNWRCNDGSLFAKTDPAYFAACPKKKKVPTATLR